MFNVYPQISRPNALCGSGNKVIRSYQFNLFYIPVFDDTVRLYCKSDLFESTNYKQNKRSCFLCTEFGNSGKQHANSGIAERDQYHALIPLRGKNYSCSVYWLDWKSEIEGKLHHGESH